MDKMDYSLSGILFSIVLGGVGAPDAVVWTISVASMVCLGYIISSAATEGYHPD